MNYKKGKIVLIIISLIFLFPVFLFADSWLPPKTRYYYSTNKNYYFEVIPLLLDRPKSNDNYCKGTLYESIKGTPDKAVWTKQLMNDVSPSRVFVTNNGKYVITFDNWANVGYGNDVVVIYGKEGNLIKSFALEDIISSHDFEEYVTYSISSRWWGANHYINEEEEILVLVLESKRESGVRKKAASKKVFIDLKNGNILDKNADSDQDN
jgi:hypothetical protein